MFSSQPLDLARKFVMHYFVDWWLLKIISLILSTICLFALTLIFLFTDGRPFPQWKSGLTPNAAVNTLSAIVKAGTLLPTFKAWASSDGCD